MRKLLLILSSFFLLQTTEAQNTALSFDGIDDFAATSAFVVPTSGDFTVEFWGYSSNFSGYREFVSQGNMGDAFYIGTTATTGEIRCGDTWTSTGVIMPLNKWVHIALVKSGSSASLYLDGILKATLASGYSISTTGTDFTMGVQYDGSEKLEGKIDEMRVWNLALTASQIKYGMYGTVDVNTAGLVADYHLNEGSGNSFANSTSVTGINGTLLNNPVWFDSPVRRAGNALYFDGVDDQVVVPANSVFDQFTGTIECRVKPDNLVGNAFIVGNRGPAGTNYSFHMSKTDIGMWDGFTYQTIPFISNPGQWYHLAFVCDGIATTFYVDGTSIGSLGSVYSGNTGLPFVIGIAKNSGSDDEPFNGMIDEVRVWSTLRSSADINSYKNVTLTGSEPGLVAHYTFNQGIGNGDNTGLLTAIDGTSNNNYGTLSNFALNTSSSNWVPNESLAVLPVKLSDMSLYNLGHDVLVQWITNGEENSSEFVVERSADGIHFSAIGHVQAQGDIQNAITYSFTDATPLRGMNFYRLKLVDLNGSFVYSSIKAISLNEKSNSSLLVYPNPVKDQCRIVWNDKSCTNFTLSGNGMVIRQINPDPSSNFFVLDMKGMAPGVYILKDNMGRVQKIVKN